MELGETLVLKRGDVAELLSIDECMAGVEQAFKLYAEGKALFLNEIEVIPITKNELARSLQNSQVGLQPETNPDELFERFKKGSHQTKTTGLGLALVKQTCHLYHYEVSYEYKDR